jgi:hypothetical protein
MSREIMQQALSAFEEIMFTKNVGSSHIIAKNARYALREELAKPEQEPVTNSDLYSTAGRLALELECLLLDTKDISIASKWWDSAHEALDQWRKFHLRACTELDSDEITKSCDSKPESDAMRLYQAVDRLATQAGEDAGETIDWLCGEHGGMSKLFEAYFSPKPIANPVENLEPVPVWLENDLAFKEIMKWADIYAAQTGEIYAQAALDSSKTATMARERKTLTFVVASYTSPISEPVKERISEPVNNLESISRCKLCGGSLPVTHALVRTGECDCLAQTDQ